MSERRTESQSPEEQATFRAMVRGRVQGVGFRYFVLDRARSLDLHGSVRNRPDGSVEVEACGPRTTLDRLVAQLHKGPLLSRVTAVDLEWDVDLAVHEGFKIG